MLTNGISTSSLRSELKMHKTSNNRSLVSIARGKTRNNEVANSRNSVHHARHMAKLTSGTLSSSPSLTTLTRPAPLAPIIRPQSAGAFRPRKLEPTRFRNFCTIDFVRADSFENSDDIRDSIVDDRGDLPVRINFAGAVRKLQWQVELSQLDYSHYLPIFMEGLRDLQEPYHFLALNGTLDMVEKGGNRVLPCLPHLISPIKANLVTRNQTVLCLQMKVLQRLVLCCPYTGEALVPYYRQLLSVFNLFITKRVNCGDSIDYAQRRQENIGDLILETLNIFERHGGADAFVNIKYMIPTYESCMTRR